MGGEIQDLSSQNGFTIHFTWGLLDSSCKWCKNIHCAASNTVNLRGRAGRTWRKRSFIEIDNSNRNAETVYTWTWIYVVIPHAYPESSSSDIIRYHSCTCRKVKIKHHRQEIHNNCVMIGVTWGDIRVILSRKHGPKHKMFIVITLHKKVTFWDKTLQQFYHILSYCKDLSSQVYILKRSTLIQVIPPANTHTELFATHVHAYSPILWLATHAYTLLQKKCTLILSNGLSNLQKTNDACHEKIDLFKVQNFVNFWVFRNP